MKKPKIIIVNEKDEIIGYKDRDRLNSEDIYRVSALWIENSKGECLLAQRSFNKKKDPGKWGPAVAGTNDEGETYESNIVKEAEEEIGLTNFSFKKFKKYSPDDKRRYFSTWFIASVDKEEYYFKKQEDEVEKIKWIDKNKLKEWIKEKPENFIPSAQKWSEEFLK